MDPAAPQTVLKGVAITSSLCGVAAGAYGGLKYSAPGKFLLYSSVNSGIVAATFFSIREYIVSPVLVLTHPGRQYRLRKQSLSHPIGNLLSDDVTSLSWTDIRTFRLLDSGVSGGLAGGILNVWKRGRRGFAPGLTTGALMCTLLQWCFNEFNIFRICHVSANSAAPTRHTTHNPVDASRGSPPELCTSVAMEPTPVEPRAPRSPMDHILPMFGRPISDEKYLRRLRAERDSYLRRIAELEKEG